VIGCVRRDLALDKVPRPPRQRRRGRTRKYGARLTPDKVEALPAQRSAGILYGKLAVVRYRSCRVAARFLKARFLKGRGVRAVWVELERPEQPDKPRQQRLLICTDPNLPALDVITSYAKRWAVEPLFKDMKHGWGLKEAWQRSRQGLMRWVTVRAVGYALTQMLAYTNPARLEGLARSLAAARHADRRRDPGGHRPHFTRVGPARLHRRDVGKNPRRCTPRRRTIPTDARRSRVGDRN
jgi:hypothetical protein